VFPWRRRQPELAAEAEEITSTLLVVENELELDDEITARLRALHANGLVSVVAGRGWVLDVLQPYVDDLTRRKERGARRAAAYIAIAVLSGLYGCREDTEEDMLLVRMGLPGAADDLARMVYEKVKPLQLSLPSLADECPGGNGTRRAETSVAVGVGRVTAVASLARRVRKRARPAFPRGRRAEHTAVSARG
jgi:hypothetical protein